MSRYQYERNASHGNSIQINGSVYGNVTLTTDLQPSFFKTSNYESYKNINPKRVPETCAWFLEHPTFLRWKDCNSDAILWLSADPGCGKSVLSRALIDEALVGGESATLCYFFFKDTEEQNSNTTALCALLHQLFCVHNDLLPKHAALGVRNCGQALKNDFEEMWRIFISAATDQTVGDIICILDALDECRQPDREKLITYLESFYERSADKSRRDFKLKFLVTSRPYSEIELQFSRLTRKIPTIRLAGEDESHNISKEISIVMKSQIREIAESLELEEDAELSLENGLKAIPNRTYLWLHLILDEVKKSLEQTPKKLQNVLNTLPKTIEDAYEKILTRCVQDKARKILYIVVAAQRPLTLSELDVALEINPDQVSPSLSYEDLDFEGTQKRKKTIRKSCGLFISIVDSRVFLIHQTAREFLIRKSNEISGPSKWKHSFNLQEAHRVFFEICVTHLFFHEFQECRFSTDPDDDFLIDTDNESLIDYDEDFIIIYKDAVYRLDRLGKTLTEKHALLDYSANYWIAHAKEANSENPAWVTKTAKLCNISDGASCTWFIVYSMSHYIPYESVQPSQHALYWPTYFGLINEIKFLFKRNADLDAQCAYSESILRTAAENEDHGKELMTLFLKRWGKEVKITEEVVKAAAKNRKSGNAVITFLFERGVENVEISTGLVAEVARSFDERVMELLLDWRGDEIRITEEVVVAAANARSKGVMALLLDQRGGEVKITEQVVKAAAWNAEEIMRLLLNRRGDEIEITEEVVVAAARRKGVMSLLLDQRGGEVKITEKVVIEAVGAWNAEEILGLLLDRRGDEVKITEKVVVAAARKKGVMSLLLDRRGDDINITEKVVVAAAQSKGAMSLLLDRRGDEVKITEKVVVTAARSTEVITLLLDRRGSTVEITKEVAIAAARGRELISLLDSEQGSEIENIEEVAGPITRGKEAISLLLGQRGGEVKITEEIVVAAARSKEMIAFLLDQRGDEVKITEKVVLVAVQSEEVMSLLLDRRADEVKITERALAAAAQSEEVMSLLLDRRADEVKVTEKVVVVAARSKEMMSLLLDWRGDEVKITEEVAVVAAQSEEVMTLLLDRRGGEVKITEEIVEAAAQSEEVMLLLFDRRRDDIILTQGLIERAASDREWEKRVIELVCKSHQDGHTISEHTAASIFQFSTPKTAAIILQWKRSEFNVTERLVVAAAKNLDYGNRIIALLLQWRGEEIKITKEVVKAAAGNWRTGNEIIWLFFEKSPDIVRDSFIADSGCFEKFSSTFFRARMPQGQWMYARARRADRDSTNPALEDDQDLLGK
jgi:hypothetical protein